MKQNCALLMLTRVGQVLMAIGVFGFFADQLIPYADDWLKGVELPTFSATNTIALQDGGRLTGTMPTQRVQRYGSDGRFRNGWFVAGGGGNFAIGLTSDGKVSVCTARGRELFLFDLDGRPAGRQPCFTAPREVPALLQPGDLRDGQIQLQPVVAVQRPDLSLLAILMVPLWHPFIAWSIAAVGYGLFRIGRRS